MATVIWNGSSSGDVTTAGNFTGGAPGIGDSVYSIANPANNMTTGAFPSLVAFTIGGSSTCSLAGATFGNVTGTMTLGGIASSHTVVTSGTIATLKNQMASGGTLNLTTSGTVTNFITRGVNTVNVAAAVVVTNIKNQGSTIYALSNATAITLYKGFGVMNSELRNITTATLAGVRSYLTTTGTTTGTGSSSGAVVTCDVINGATYNKKSAATDTTINLVGPNSKFTVMGNTNEPLATATVTTLEYWENTIRETTVAGYSAVVTNLNPIGVDSMPVGSPS